MCEAVSDRMPAVASGQREWTAEEGAHLSGCAECSAEWKLVSVAATLGRNVTVDAAGLAPQVLERVRAAARDDQRRRWVRRVALVGGLAIAALLLLIAVPRNRGIAPVPQTDVVVAAEPAELRLAELDDAAPAELEMVLAELDEPAVPASSLDGPDLEGLDLSQVERALRSWEES
jgi:hypothetical protein